MKQFICVFFRPLVIMCAVAGLIFGTAGCNKMPNNGVPIYVRVDSPTVISGYPFGSSSNRIPSVWASSGSTILGAFEMPINIPVLAGGDVPMALSAGIYDNGIVSAQMQYPFYQPDTFTIHNAIPGHVYVHHPVYQYYSFTQVGLNCDFETVNYFDSITSLTSRVDSSVYEGLRSGGLILSATDSARSAIQSTPVVINTDGREAYVELNWKIDNPNVFCDVGVVATQYSGGQITFQQAYPKLTLQSLGHWQKTYLDFDNEIGTNGGLSFQVYFTAYHSRGRQDTVYLDNVKILYFH